jgi:hypothetical protein
MASLEMVDGLILPNYDVSVNQPCPGCMCGKMQRSKFKLGRTRTTQSGQLIHSNVCGPMHIATPRGSKYFVLFTDDFSGYRTVYFLKQKSEVADSFKDFVNNLRTETGQQVHTLRADNGGEFTGHQFREWRKEGSLILKASRVFSSDTAPHKRHIVSGIHSQGRSLVPAFSEFLVPVVFTPFKPFLLREKMVQPTLVIIRRLGFQSPFFTQIKTSSFHRLFFVSFPFFLRQNIKNF